MIKELTEHQGEVTSADLSDNGQFIVTLSKDDKVQIWNRQGQKLSELPKLQEQVNWVEFSSTNLVSRVVKVNLLN